VWACGVVAVVVVVVVVVVGVVVVVCVLCDVCVCCAVAAGVVGGCSWGGRIRTSVYNRVSRYGRWFDHLAAYTDGKCRRRCGRAGVRGRGRRGL